MAWVKVDDKFSRGRKVKRAARELGGGKKARARVLALWLDAMSYCNLNLTDGFFPDDELDELPDAKPREVFDAMSIGDDDLGAIVERCASGRNGWVFRNYAEYQPTKADVEAKLERDRKRKRGHADSARNPSGRNADSTHTEPDRPEPSRTDRPGPVEVQAQAVQDEPQKLIQSARSAPTFDSFRQLLKAAAYAYLGTTEDGIGNDLDMAVAIREAAAAVKLFDFEGRHINGIVYEVRGYLASKAVSA